jgi:hypothetical protein
MVGFAWRSRSIADIGKDVTAGRDISDDLRRPLDEGDPDGRCSYEPGQNAAKWRLVMRSRTVKRWVVAAVSVCAVGAWTLLPSSGAALAGGIRPAGVPAAGVSGIQGSG